MSDPARPAGGRYVFEARPELTPGTGSDRLRELARRWRFTPPRPYLARLLAELRKLARYPVRLPESADLPCPVLTPVTYAALPRAPTTPVILRT